MKPGKFEINGPRADIVVYEANTLGELEVMHYSSDNGYVTMLTHWYPNEEDIRKLIDGKPIQLHIVGTIHPWVKVEV